MGQLFGGLLLYARRRLRTPPGYLSSMLAPSSGRAITVDEHRDALGIDAMLRRLGVRCLWRAAVVTEALRREGVGARIALSVSIDDPSVAHAECAVDDVSLRLSGPDMVPLR